MAKTTRTTKGDYSKGRKGFETKVSAEEVAMRKAVAALEAIPAALLDNANPHRLQELIERAKAAAMELPPEPRDALLKELQEGLKLPDPTEPTDENADESNAEPEPQPLPANLKELLAAELDVLRKRREQLGNRWNREEKNDRE